ncbi:MAG: SpoVR family protein [Chloroflexi bacterium]|nr:SpoVR family protein [Chloroflexota bacterium]
MEDLFVKELEDAIEPIWEIAQRFGLDPFQVHFELVPPSIMYEFGSYGLPGRFSHWSHGKVYNRMKTSYDYGLSKIYELVINTDPSYAFLMEGNSLLQDKLVIAHVLGHCDFFKHNEYFARTNRRMVETASLNADRIRRYEYEHGRQAVERFLDAVLSIQEHIDPYPSRVEEGDRQSLRGQRVSGAESAHPSPDDYSDLFGLTPDEKQMRPSKELQPLKNHLPAQPEKDLVGFVMEHSRHLEPWQRDVMGIVRQEMLYFVPQMQTKVCNEGWASMWHMRIMRELEVTDAEFTEYAEMNAGVVAPSRHNLNPYYLGVKLLEDIERRWDNPTEEERLNFGRQGGEGRKKLFEVRQMENDVSLIRNYLTRQLVEDLDLYLYERQGDQWVIVDKEWRNVRDSIVARMANFGNPTILVEDGDYHHNGELYLRHIYDNQDLDLTYGEKTLEHVHALWGRPVHLQTKIEFEETLLSYDGNKHEREIL